MPCSRAKTVTIPSGGPAAEFYGLNRFYRPSESRKWDVTELTFPSTPLSAAMPRLLPVRLSSSAGHTLVYFFRSTHTVYCRVFCLHFLPVPFFFGHSLELMSVHHLVCAALSSLRKEKVSAQRPPGPAGMWLSYYLIVLCCSEAREVPTTFPLEEHQTTPHW